METFWPGDSTCTPAITTCMPGCKPSATTASLPSAVATVMGCSFTVILALSSTHTAVDLPLDTLALVGSLMTCTPLRSNACGTTDTVVPSARESLASSATFTTKVRVTGSALAATSRTTPFTVVLLAHTFTSTAEPALIMTTLSSGTENTTSRGPSWAICTTGVPALTTWPGSALMAGTPPAMSATRVV